MLVIEAGDVLGHQYRKLEPELVFHTVLDLDRAMKRVGSGSSLQKGSKESLGRDKQS